MRSYNTHFLICVMIAFATTACTEGESTVAGEPEVVVSGFQFTEGPYWHPDGFLIFSDIPADRIYRWEPSQDEAEVYIEPSHNSNGITATPDGELVLAQHAGRVSIVSEDLELTPIVEQYDEMRLNSPNDVVVRSDGLIYFTDPTFGVSDEDRELDFSGVYRINADSSLTLMYDGFSLPNGIAFSPDESQLYVNNSETGEILRFDVTENGNFENMIEFANIGAMTEVGGADGMKTDSEGNLYTTGPNGLIILSPEGEEIERIEFDQQITNLAWGGPTKNQLFITSQGDVYRLQMAITGW